MRGTNWRSQFPGTGRPDEVLVPALRSSALGEAKLKSDKPKDCYF
jgi:hypothetical protein